MNGALRMSHAARILSGPLPARTAASDAPVYQKAPTTSIAMATPQATPNATRPAADNAARMGGSIQNINGSISVSHRGPQDTPCRQSTIP